MRQIRFSHPVLTPTRLLPPINHSISSKCFLILIKTLTFSKSNMSSKSPASSSPATTTVDHGGGATTAISALHQDIIQTHILTRLDGPTLAATSCASSQLRALSTQDTLWRQICTAAWPSIDDEKVRHVISTFPAGHRSFFSDSFPVIDHQQPSKLNLDHHRHPTSSPTTELISCVDVYYKDTLLITKTRVVETVTGWFHHSPFRVELFDSKESVPTPILNGGEGDTWLKDLEENLTLSWIIIDPSKKRAVNISSGRAVTVERQWLTGDVQARFATIMAGDGRLGSEVEYVKCEVVVVVTCGGGKEGGGMHVREASLQVEDMEGRSLSGRDSLVILGEAMEKGKRRNRGKGQGQDGKERYEEFVERKKVRKEKKEGKERALDLACICFGVTIFFALWSFILMR